MATLKLNQVIALEKGAKGNGEGALTKAYHQLQQAIRLSGITKVYRPRDEDGERLPPEGTLLQLRATEVIDGIVEPLGRLLDLQLTKDAGNQVANASIVVDGVTLAENVPVTFLLTLEKKLTDLLALVGKLPVLPPEEKWAWDENQNAYVSSSESVRTKKVLRNHVKAEATDKHPAQVDVFGEDQVVGTWTKTLLSGALPQSQVNLYRQRVQALADAVKLAREQANMTPVEMRQVGTGLLSYVFA